MKHPDTFETGDEFMDYVYHNWPRNATHVEMQGHGHWMAFVNDEPIAVYDENSGTVDWLTDNVTEIHQPMEMLKELLQLDEAEKKKSKKKVSKVAAKAVYHRDYVKTKKKPYRKYDPSDYASGEGKE